LLNNENRPWIAFFSQTGTEIVNIHKQLGVTPDMIVTNNRPSHLRTVNEYIYRNWGDKFYMLPNKPTVSNYKQIITKLHNPLITLHGWLRIVPKAIVEQYEIYNGHPALINEHPELKGKDKQEDIFYHKNKYPVVGSVIHQVTEGVDEGDILISVSAPNTAKNLDDAYNILYKTSFETWKTFFNSQKGLGK